MDQSAIRALARAVYGTDQPRGAELKAWLRDGRMSESQRKRLGGDAKPACFATEEQWLTWCMMEALRPPAHSGYCYDCTACYAKQMRDQGRCDHPSTEFRLAGRPAVLVGFRPARPARK